MLFSTLRAQVQNTSGNSATVTVKRRFWYIDPSTGRPSYGAWATVISSAVVATGSVTSQASADDNTTSGYLGAEYRMTVVATAAATGVVTLLLQNQDSGSAWPSDGFGIPIGAITPINGTVADDFTA